MDFKKLLADPKAQEVLAELKTALPILLERAGDRGVELLMQLLVPDTRDAAIMEMRQLATPEQWEAFHSECVANGKLASIQVVEDRDFVVGLVAKVLLGIADVIRTGVTGGLA